MERMTQRYHSDYLLKLLNLVLEMWQWRTYGYGRAAWSCTMIGWQQWLVVVVVTTTTNHRERASSVTMFTSPPLTRFSHQSKWLSSTLEPESHRWGRWFTHSTTVAPSLLALPHSRQHTPRTHTRQLPPHPNGRCGFGGAAAPMEKKMECWISCVMGPYAVITLPLRCSDSKVCAWRN